MRTWTTCAARAGTGSPASGCATAPPTRQAALSRQGRYQQVRDNLRVKEVRSGRHPGQRSIICHNPAEAERDKAQRDADDRAGCTAELDRISRPAATPQAKTAQEGLADDAHQRAECALRDHPTLGRYLRQTTLGRLVIDRAKIAAEERLDGKYLLSTSDPDLSAEDVALGYKNLLEAERGFRDLKTTLELRPVFHRLEPRIRAHVLLCWLALLLIRVAERTTGLTWRRIAIELGRVHAVTLAGTAGTVVHTTPLTDPQRQILGLPGRPAAPGHHAHPHLSTPPTPAPRGHTHAKHHKPQKPSTHAGLRPHNTLARAHQLRNSGEPAVEDRPLPRKRPARRRLDRPHHTGSGAPVAEGAFEEEMPFPERVVELGLARERDQQTPVLGAEDRLLLQAGGERVAAEPVLDPP